LDRSNNPFISTKNNELKIYIERSVTENTVGNSEELGRKLEYKGHFTLGTVMLFPGSMTQHCITAKRKYVEYKLEQT